MKNLFLAVLFFTMTAVSAQSNFEKMAQNVTNEMQRVLELTDKQADQLYLIHLDKVKVIEGIKTNKELNESEKKEAIKQEYIATSRKFERVIDRETVKKWHAYVKKKYS